MFEPSLQQVMVIEDRAATRLRDRVAVKVAEEVAAKAMAESHGWDWPGLEGCATVPGADLTEHRRQQRARLRHLAKVACRAFVDHLSEGGRYANEHDTAALITASVQADQKTMAERVAEKRASFHAVPTFDDGGGAL